MVDEASRWTLDARSNQWKLD